ncbi:MAG: acyl-CoA synthetase [Burkholderiales bacterium]
MSAVSEQPGWRTVNERGAPVLMRFMAWFILAAGRRWARLMLPPIVLYYAVAVPQARRASRHFLERALGRKPGLIDLMRHLFSFAAVLVDRVYFVAGRYEAFEIRVFGQEALDTTLRSGGCVLLGSHLGSFEALRACGENAGGCNVVMIMDEANARKIRSVLLDINPRASDSIINVGDPASAIHAKERLDAGALVGILGDRARAGDKTIPLRFLGHPAAFPLGPMLLTAALRAPVFVGFGLYRGGNRYDIHFEQLTDRLELPRDRRAEALAVLVEAYAQRLQHYARLAPYNWFNFYDFWH